MTSPKNNEKIEGYNPLMFKRMRLVYIALSIINIIVVITSFGLIGYSLYDAQKSFNCISKIETNLLKSNNSVMMIVIDVNNMDYSISEVNALFDEIDIQKNEFEKIDSLNDKVTSAFYMAYDKMNEYRTHLRNYREQYTSSIGNEEHLTAFQSQILERYQNDIEPLMEDATRLMNEAVTAQQDETTAIFFRTAKSVVIVLALLLLILALGLVSIMMMERSSRRAATELQKRADEIEKTSEKLDKSRQKTKAMAYMNILTGLKNRYALEEDLSKRLESDNFHISNFDYDNFRNFNEVYGRNFGDEFISAVAERLKDEFSKYADIYNLACDEFTFVFKSNISEAQALHISQKISEVLTSNYTVNNVTVHLNVSGCTYHYLAGEYKDINSLIGKLDSAMHAAKSSANKVIFEANRM